MPRSGACSAALTVLFVVVALGCSPDATERSTTVVPSPSVPTPTVLPATTPATTPATAVPASTAAVTLTATPTPVPFAPGAAALLDGNVLASGSRIGLIANQASTVDGASTIDLLAIHPDLELAALFAPEHGPRGDLDAGVTVAGGVDAATGVTVHSLYGATRAPTPEMLDGLDALVYDLQGVGVRHYTYITTMGLAMQAAAAADLPFVVLDRPNPLGVTVSSGYLLESSFESFVGPYPIPQVHALTAGELANAIVGERWVPGLDDLTLILVPMEGWKRDQHWNDLGVEWSAPSPGLPSADAATVYPGTVFFEATTLSYGRGTDYVFRQIGAPWLDGPALATSLTELDVPGVAFEPVTFTPRQGELVVVPAAVDTEVHGVRWTVTDAMAFDPVTAGIAAIQVVLEQGSEVGAVVIDRPDFFDLLAGTDELRLRLVAGESLEVVVDAWRDETAAFDRSMRRYRLYPD